VLTAITLRLAGHASPTTSPAITGRTSTHCPILPTYIQWYMASQPWALSCAWTAGNDTHRSVDSCHPFRVVRIGSRPGMIASRLSVLVRLAREVVRRGGSQVGSRGTLGRGGLEKGHGELPMAINRTVLICGCPALPAES